MGLALAYESTEKMQFPWQHVKHDSGRALLGGQFQAYLQEKVSSKTNGISERT